MTEYNKAQIKTNFRGVNQVNIPVESRIACLNVSIDQKNEKGLKLEAIISKANRTFGKLDIMLCDTLNRFNLVMNQGLSFSDAEHKAREMGDVWIMENKIFLEKQKIPGKVIRWNEWRAHPDFESVYTQVRQLVIGDSYTNTIFNNVIFDYLRRKNIERSKDAIDLSFQYLLEECAIIRLWAKSGYNYELYPAQRSPAISYYLEKALKNRKENFLYFLRVEFKS